MIGDGHSRPVIVREWRVRSRVVGACVLCRGSGLSVGAALASTPIGPLSSGNAIDEQNASYLGLERLKTTRVLGLLLWFPSLSGLGMPVAVYTSPYARSVRRSTAEAGGALKYFDVGALSVRGLVWWPAVVRCSIWCSELLLHWGLPRRI